MLFSGNLHVFLFPESMDPLVIHPPTVSDKFSMDSRTTEARPLLSHATHLPQQPFFVGRSAGSVALSTPRLAQHTAGPTLGDVLRPQTTTYFLHCPSPSIGAYQFPFEASFKMLMSNA